MWFLVIWVLSSAPLQEDLLIQSQNYLMITEQFCNAQKDLINSGNFKIKPLEGTKFVAECFHSEVKFGNVKSNEI